MGHSNPASTVAKFALEIATLTLKMSLSVAAVLNANDALAIRIR